MSHNMATIFGQTMATIFGQTMATVFGHDIQREELNVLKVLATVNTPALRAWCAVIKDNGHSLWPQHPAFRAKCPQV